jgi:hypothetical protein
VKGTKAYGLLISARNTNGTEALRICVYADAAFADDAATRFSTAGHVAMINGTPIFWTSRLQTLTTLSTSEAEFINLTPAGKTLLWLRNLLSDFKVKLEKPVVLFTDSKNAMAMVMNPLNAARTNYIDIRYKWVIYRVNISKDFVIHHIGTNAMIADGLTKPLTKEKHVALMRGLGVGLCPWN